MTRGILRNQVSRITRLVTMPRCTVDHAVTAEPSAAAPDVPSTSALWYLTCCCGEDLPVSVAFDTDDRYPLEDRQQDRTFITLKTSR